MVKSTLVLAILVFVFSCNSNPKPIGTEAPADASNNSNPDIDNLSRNPMDSLRDPHNYFYLSDLPTRTIGQLIIEDSIKAIDNEISFRCLDSLTSTDPASRAFYFLVFKKIIDNSDGALSEVVGEFSKKYIENHPKEFATYAASFSKSQMELWAFQTVEYVLAAVEQKQLKNADEWTRKIIKNCKDCDEAQLKTMRKFNSLLLQAAKDHDEVD